ncbi:MAG: glucosamine inositolphosphorylceramide transferase family protein, partial [Acidimicrobiales bacterium]
LAPVLSEVPVLRCQAIRRGRYSEYFADEDVAEVVGHDLDFILRFDFGIIRGPILKAARHGVWSFHHGDEEHYRGGPPCFWEIFDGAAVTGSMLQRLTDRLDGGVVLQKGFFRTIDHSYARNRDAAYLGGVEWPGKVCADIGNGLATYLDAPPTSSAAPIRRNPRAGQTLVFMLKLGRNFVRNQVRALAGADQWAVGVVAAPIQDLVHLDPEVRPTPQWLPEPPRARYLADPFGVEHDGAVTLLVEDYDYRTGRGTIATIEVGGQGAVSVPEPAMAISSHASYPYLFDHDGERYCVPETHQAREAALYRATDFPTGWTKVCCLVEGLAALNPTVFRHEDRWWLLCTDYEEGGNTKLHAWFAAELTGPWTPHDANPVKTDVRSARPAGTPFVHEGALFRPAQDSTRTYGGAVVINRVLTLTPTAFSEETVRVIEPDPAGPYPHGIHTLSAAGDVTLIDGKRTRFVWPAFRRDLGARVDRLRGGGAL